MLHALVALAVAVPNLAHSHSCCKISTPVYQDIQLNLEVSHQKVEFFHLGVYVMYLSSLCQAAGPYIGQAATHWAHQCFQVLEHLEDPHQEEANDANAQFHKHDHLVKVQVTMWSLECCGAKVLEVLADSMHWTSSCWSHFKAYPHRASHVFDSFTCVNLIVNCL